MDIQSIADAIKSLSSLVTNTSNNVDLVLKYLNDYEYVSNVRLYVPAGTVIKGNSVTILNIDTDKIIQDTSDEFWSKYFIHKNEVFSGSIPINIDYNETTDKTLLNKDTVSKESILDKNNLNAIKLNYSTDVDLSDIGIYTALPLSMVNEKYGKIDEAIVIEDLTQWKISISIDDVDIKSQRDMFIVENAEMDTSILKAKNIKNIVQDVNLSLISSNYVLKNGTISKYSVIPDNAEHNMETIDTLFDDTLFRKQGDDMILEFSEAQESELVTDAINAYFENGAIFDIITNNGNYFIQKQNLNAAINNIVGQYKI